MQIIRLSFIRLNNRFFVIEHLLIPRLRRNNSFFMLEKLSIIGLSFLKPFFGLHKLPVVRNFLVHSFLMVKNLRVRSCLRLMTLQLFLKKVCVLCRLGGRGLYLSLEQPHFRIVFLVYRISHKLNYFFNFYLILNINHMEIWKKYKPMFDSEYFTTELKLFYLDKF